MKTKFILNWLICAHFRYLFFPVGIRRNPRKAMTLADAYFVPSYRLPGQEGKSVEISGYI